MTKKKTNKSNYYKQKNIEWKKIQVISTHKYRHTSRKPNVDEIRDFRKRNF